MTAADLVRELRSRGVQLVADGETLRCRPKSALSVEDLTALKSMKAEVLAALAHAPPGRQVRSLKCFSCKRDRFWRSTSGVVICGNCHPPASPKLVAGWDEPAS